MRVSDRQTNRPVGRTRSGALLTALALLLIAGPASPARADSSVDTYTGSYSYSRTDIVTFDPYESLFTVGEDAGPRIQFVRTYNSGDTRVTPLGPGWTHSYNIRLDDPGDRAGDVILVGPQGRSDRHTFNADGTYTPRYGVPITLIKNADGTHVASHEDGTVWRFDSRGRLLSSRDPRGNETMLVYNSDGRLSHIRDPLGRGALELAYDQETGRLTSVTDWLDPPRTVRYVYDSQGRLSQVNDREGHATRFTYYGVSHLLAAITDALGHIVLTIEYDLEGRAVTRRDARGVRTGQTITMTFAKQPDGGLVSVHSYPPSAFDPSWRTTITDTFDLEGRIIRRVTEPSSTDEPLVEEWVYDVNGKGTSSRKGGSTTTAFTDGESDSCLGALLFDTSGLDATAEVKRALRAAARVSADVSHDALGRPVRFEVADEFSTAFGEGVVHVWVEYDREDRPRLIGSDGPWLGQSGGVSELRYDPVGNLTAFIDAEGQRTELAYDERDSLSRIMLPSGDQWQIEYDDRGHVARMEIGSTERGNEQVIDSAYDGLRRLRRVAFHLSAYEIDDDVAIEFSYDAEGQCRAHTMANSFSLPSLEER